MSNQRQRNKHQAGGVSTLKAEEEALTRLHRMEMGVGWGRGAPAFCPLTHSPATQE